MQWLASWQVYPKRRRRSSSLQRCESQLHALIVFHFFHARILEYFFLVLASVTHIFAIAKQTENREEKKNTKYSAPISNDTSIRVYTSETHRHMAWHAVDVNHSAREQQQQQRNKNNNELHAQNPPRLPPVHLDHKRMCVLLSLLTNKTKNNSSSSITKYHHTVIWMCVLITIYHI